MTDDPYRTPPDVPTGDPLRRSSTTVLTYILVAAVLLFVLAGFFFSAPIPQDASTEELNAVGDASEFGESRSNRVNVPESDELDREMDGGQDYTVDDAN